MNPILESQQLVAAAREERARSCAFWGLNPADFDTPQATQTPAVALLQAKAQSYSETPAFVRLQRHIMALLRGKRG